MFKNTIDIAQQNVSKWVKTVKKCFFDFLFLESTKILAIIPCFHELFFHFLLKKPFLVQQNLDVMGETDAVFEFSDLNLRKIKCFNCVFYNYFSVTQ